MSAAQHTYTRFPSFLLTSPVTGVSPVRPPAVTPQSSHHHKPPMYSPTHPPEKPSKQWRRWEHSTAAAAPEPQRLHFGQVQVGFGGVGREREGPDRRWRRRRQRRR
ncbi:hypothetical protein HanIR_Chr17g0864901 [Helianthus annuus]|nr:hypothetical protein HanIR_Chr17g0864901 [Helianthus annuus]